MNYEYIANKSFTHSGPAGSPANMKNISLLDLAASKSPLVAMALTEGPIKRWAKFTMSSLVRSPWYSNTRSPLMLKMHEISTEVFAKYMYNM